MAAVHLLHRRLSVARNSGMHKKQVSPEIFKSFYGDLSVQRFAVVRPEFEAMQSAKDDRLVVLAADGPVEFLGFEVEQIFRNGLKGLRLSVVILRIDHFQQFYRGRSA